LTDYFWDLTDLISLKQSLDWDDIFFSYRNYINVPHMIPLDGDLLSLYYRTDILEHFDLPVPKTWQEYNDVAETVHGETYNGTTLIGSCVPRKLGCSAYIWTYLVLSSMTQNQGTSTGFLFDSLTMEPLTSKALEKAIEYLMGQVKYGAPDEFDDCNANIKWMNEGRCVLTYNWGDSFTAQKGSNIDGLLGVAPTPGSPQVYDRRIHELVDCTEELCGKYGFYDGDSGWINRAPYAAFGGWSGAISIKSNSEKALETVSFFSFMSNHQESIALNGLEPYRKSQMNVSTYVDLGYSLNQSSQYVDTVSASLDSENVVMDIRFPGSPDMNGIMDEEITSFLITSYLSGFNSTKRIDVSSILTTQDGQSEPISSASVVNSITYQLTEIISADGANIIREYQESLNYNPSVASATEKNTNKPSDNSSSKIWIVFVVILILAIAATVYYFYAK